MRIWWMRLPWGMVRTVRVRRALRAWRRRGIRWGSQEFEAVPVVAVVENEAGEVAEGVEDEFADLAGAFVVMRVVVGWGEIAAEVGGDGGGVAA